MRCSKCGTERIGGRKLCAECGDPFPDRCSKCGSENLPKAKFCVDCGAALEASAVTAATRPERAPVRVAETTAENLQGGRKMVTALFADIKGSMELIEDLDPEEARAAEGLDSADLKDAEALLNELEGSRT